MASVCPIEISDEEDEPLPAKKPVPPDVEGPVSGPHVARASDEDADSVHSSEDYVYVPPENEIDLNDLSVHESDIEEGDIFADNLQRFTELQRQTAERLEAEPLPPTPSPPPPSGAAKRPAPKTRERGKRRRTKTPEPEDDDDDLAKLLALSPAAPTTRRTRSSLSLDSDTPVTPLPDPDEQKSAVAESPLSQPEPAISVPEETDRPFTARVQVGRLIIRLQMRRTERLQRLFDAVADELSLPSRRVCLGQRDIIYSPHQTPDDVGLGLFDMIEFWEGDSAPAAAPLGAPPVDPDSLELKVQSANRRSTVTLRLRRTEPMSLLMERYATERGVALEKLRFRFDGEALDPLDTPETLDLEGGECVDVHDL